MKKMKLFFLITQIVLFSSCVKDEEFYATISLENNTEDNIKNFILKGDTGYTKTIDNLGPNEKEDIEISWLGISGGLMGTFYDGKVIIEISYSINDISYDSNNETNVNENYDSEIVIEADDNIKISVNSIGYTIE